MHSPGNTVIYSVLEHAVSKGKAKVVQLLFSTLTYSQCHFLLLLDVCFQNGSTSIPQFQRACNLITGTVDIESLEETIKIPARWITRGTSHVASAQNEARDYRLGYTIHNNEQTSKPKGEIKTAASVRHQPELKRCGMK